MASNWAIAVGISQYALMESLPYAKQDAAAVRDFLTKDAKFDQVYYFADDSSEVVFEGVTISTQPDFANLKHFLQVRFAIPFLKPEDTLWFFFSGHGLHYGNRDYLIPYDADPENAESTAIAIDDVAECLKRSGTNNIVLVLDACHTEEQKFGQGFGTDPGGVITLFASDFNQTSQAIESLKHGSFTYVFLEGLRLLGEFRNATLEHLHLYVRDRLPKLNRQFSKLSQLPRAHADSSLASSSISLPQVASSKGFFKRFFLQQKVGAAMKGATPLFSDNDQTGTTSLAITLISSAVVGIGVILYYAFYENPVRRPFSPSASTSAGKQANQLSAKPDGSKPDTTLSNQRNQLISPELSFEQEPLQRVPKPGKYASEDPQFSTSRREIGKSGARICIKIVNGSTISTPDVRSQVVVSSVSPRQDGFYVDATQEKLRMDGVYTKFADSKSVWERLETDVDESGQMAECLASTGRFIVRQGKGE
ncbi:MAG: hypothetical protein HC866_19120 [Leptolyngbyaceae cyanobacterium RU_5_1]|nr:hypothetical protein [Leptolyngbyaceae cyanobacterium RU_5_1]